MKISDEAVLEVRYRIEMLSLALLVGSTDIPDHVLSARIGRIMRWCGPERWDASTEAFLKKIGLAQ